MFIYRRKFYGTRSRHELFISYRVCQPPIPLCLSTSVYMWSTTDPGSRVPLTLGRNAKPSSPEVLGNREGQGAQKWRWEGTRAYLPSMELPTNLFSRNQNKLRSLKGLRIKSSRMNWHSLLVSMEQPTGLCWAASEVWVLSASPWRCWSRWAGSLLKPATPGNKLPQNTCKRKAL